jgi:hypothetical protein
MNKLMKNKMHEGISTQSNKCIKKQFHQPFNKDCPDTQYTVYVHKLITQWTG